jgi:hypothetical protein
MEEHLWNMCEQMSILKDRLVEIERELLVIAYQGNFEISDRR